MKTRKFTYTILILLLSFVSISLHAQLKINSTGSVVVGENFSQTNSDVLKVHRGLIIDPNMNTMTNPAFGLKRIGSSALATWSVDLDLDGLNFWEPYPSPYWGNCKLILKDAGGIGIKNCYPAYELDVIGIVRANSFLVNSDAKLKNDITPLSNCLSKISQLNGSSYWLYTNPVSKGMYEK